MVGSFGVTFETPRRFDAAELAFVQAMADQCAVALERARLFVAERRAREEAERLAAEAQAAVGARDEFLSVAAHELKTPMTSLVGYAQLVLRQLARSGTVDPERVTQALTQVERQSRRLGSLIDQLLDVTRLETGKLRLRRQPADLVELAREAVGVVSASQPGRQVELVAEDAVYARVDPLRLGQVLTNLLENALKFSPPGRPIQVAVAADGAEARLAVRDYGAGVPEAERTLVFDRFYQAREAERQGGMGLGLFLSRQIVDLHDGSIALEAPEDGGTRVVVRLPLAERPVPESEYR
jgi:signal transduction histidine kinase